MDACSGNTDLKSCLDSLQPDPPKPPAFKFADSFPVTYVTAGKSQFGGLAGYTLDLKLALRGVEFEPFVTPHVFANYNTDGFVRTGAGVAITGAILHPVLQLGGGGRYNYSSQTDEGSVGAFAVLGAVVLPIDPTVSLLLGVDAYDVTSMDSSDNYAFTVNIGGRPDFLLENIRKLF